MSESAAAGCDATTTVLAVRLGKDLHAIPVEAVEEVLPALPIEAVPHCPPFVRGVVFVRGHLIPVIDAAERLGLKDHLRDPDPHIVCVHSVGRIVGVEVDEALDLLEINLAHAISTDEVGARASLLRSLVEHDGQIFRILDPDRLVARDEAALLARMPQTESLEGIERRRDSGR